MTADATRTQLKSALVNAVGTASSAVAGTTEIAKIAVEKASALSKTAVGSAFVLGEGTVKASEAIGVAALSAGTQVSTAALGASATIATAATQAAADVTTTALETGAQTVNVTTEKVGEALNAGVTLAGDTVTRTLKGINNIGEIVAGRGALSVKSTLQKQAATSIGIDARDTKDKKDALLRVFNDVQTSMNDALSTLDGVQKTALAGKMNIYKRAKCGFFRRMSGFCDASTIKRDMKAAEFYLGEFKSNLKIISETAKNAITTATEDPVSSFQKIEMEYNTKTAGAVNKFVASYKVLLDKYDALAREALGISGGRRRKTYRKKRRSLTRASRKRPSGRGRSS